MLPISIFIMVLGVLYIQAFGIPTSDRSSDDWEEEEIEKEMLKLYRQKKAQLSPLDQLSEKEALELKKLEQIEKKWDWDEGFV